VPNISPRHSTAAEADARPPSYQPAAPARACRRHRRCVPCSRRRIRAHAVIARFFDKTRDANCSLAWQQNRTITLKRRGEARGLTAWTVKQSIARAVEILCCLRIPNGFQITRKGPDFIGEYFKS